MDHELNDPGEALDAAADPLPVVEAAPHPAAVQPSRRTQPDGRTGSRRVVVEIAQTLVLTVVIFLAIQAFVAQPFKVEGASMESTFVQGDYVLVDRLTPRWSPYARGQVVVLKAPEAWDDRGEPFIKRVIGVGGDTVEIRDDGSVAVNGTTLDEPYLFRDASGILEPTLADGDTRWVVPQGDLFVMGDHRQASMDGRVFGPIPVSSVIGRGVVRYWPVPDIGIVGTPTYEASPAP